MLQRPCIVLLRKTQYFAEMCVYTRQRLFLPIIGIHGTLAQITRENSEQKREWMQTVIVVLREESMLQVV